MKVISLIVLGQRIAGLLRIDDDLIKVDDAVESAAANEVVQRHADLLFLGRVVALERSARERIAEGRERRSNDPEPTGVSARDQLLVAVNDRLGSRLRIMQRQAAAWPPKVIDAHHQNDRVGLGLRTSVSKRASALV